MQLGFANGLAGWNVREIGGSADGKGTVTAGSAILTEGDSFLVTLDQTLTIPPDPLQLSFIYQASFDTTDRDSMNDAFEASLMDADGHPLVYTFAPDRDSYFNLTEEMPSAVGRGTTEQVAAEGTQVSVDISHLAADTEATLVFRLVNNDTDEDTTVHILSVELTSGGDAPPTVTVGLANDTAPAGPGSDSFLNDKLTNDPTLQGTAIDDDQVQQLEIQIDDGPYLDITASLTDGQYTYDPGPLAPGPHRASVRATDSLPQSTTTSLDFVVNAPPTADAGGDRQVGEGSTISFDASGSTDTVGEIYSYAWTFEDDVTNVGPVVSRTFADDGEYVATLTVTDTAGSRHTDSAAITVDNLPVNITPLDDQPASEGQELFFSTTFVDPGVLDMHTATVDWGDGSVSETVVIDEHGGAGTVSGSHVYRDDGTFNVNVTVIDDGGATTTTSFQVIVANLPPAVLTASDFAGNEGQDREFVGTFSDPGVLDTHSAVVFWSDGTSAPGNVTESDGAGTVTATHIFADNGVYPISLVVTDNGGDSDSRDATATAVNVPPIVVPAADVSVEEGLALGIDVATFTDPGFTDETAGTQETFTAIINWGDGTPAEAGSVTVRQGAAGILTTGSVSGTHVYADDGDYSVTVQVRDDDMPEDSWSEGSFTVTVTNVAPTVAPSRDRTVDEGSPLSLEVATFVNPGFTHAAAGTEETFTATINWGDGTPDEPGVISVVQGSAGVLTRGGVAVEHEYLDDGEFTVTVTVTDDDQGSASTTFQVSVNNVAPMVNTPDDVVGNEGQSVNFVGTFTDVGILDTHTAEIFWGDGASSTGEISGSQGPLSVSGIHTYADNGHYVILVLVTDDGDATATMETAAEINNVPPSASIIGPEAGSAAAQISFTLSASDPSSVEHAVGCHLRHRLGR